MKKLLRSLFRSQSGPDLADEIILVSGLPRSGTSLMMKMLEAGGIPPLIDQIRQADRDNPKGYYEYERVKQLDDGDVAWLPGARGKAVKVISALLRHLPQDYTYRVIFMEREMAEILASQRKMLERRQEEPDRVDDAEMAALFTQHLTEIRQWLHTQPNFSVLFLNYNDLLRNPLPLLDRLNHFLGGTLDVEQMAQVIDPDLYRNRQPSSSTK